MILNLKKIWFDKIKNGEKTHEYREVKPFWEKRFNECFMNLVAHGAAHIEFVCGYSPKNATDKRIMTRVKSICIKNGLDTDLKIDKDVYDIEFEVE